MAKKCKRNQFQILEVTKTICKKFKKYKLTEKYKKKNSISVSDVKSQLRQKFILMLPNHVYQKICVYLGFDQVHKKLPNINKSLSNMIRLNNDFWIEYQHQIQKENKDSVNKVQQEFLKIYFNSSPSNQLEIGNIKVQNLQQGDLYILILIYNKLKKRNPQNLELVPISSSSNSSLLNTVRNTLSHHVNWESQQKQPQQDFDEWLHYKISGFEKYERFQKDGLSDYQLKQLDVLKDFSMIEELLVQQYFKAMNLLVEVSISADCSLKSIDNLYSYNQTQIFENQPMTENLTVKLKTKMQTLKMIEIDELQKLDDDLQLGKRYFHLEPENRELWKQNMYEHYIDLFLNGEDLNGAKIQVENPDINQLYTKIREIIDHENFQRAQQILQVGRVNAKGLNFGTVMLEIQKFHQMVAFKNMNIQDFNQKIYQSILKCYNLIQNQNFKEFPHLHQQNFTNQIKYKIENTQKEILNLLKIEGNFSIFEKRLEIYDNFDYLLQMGVLNQNLISKLFQHSSQNGVFIDKIIIRLLVKIYFNIFNDTQSAQNFINSLQFKSEKQKTDMLQQIFELKLLKEFDWKYELKEILINCCIHPCELGSYQIDFLSFYYFENGQKSNAMPVENGFKLFDNLYKKEDESAETGFSSIKIFENCFSLFLKKFGKSYENINMIKISQLYKREKKVKKEAICHLRRFYISLIQELENE